MVEIDNPTQQTEFDSSNLLEAIENEEIPRLSNGRLDGAFLMGTVVKGKDENGKEKKGWRKRKVQPELSKRGIITDDPDMDNWDPDVHPQAEALAMSEFGVLATRLETPEGIFNAGLGSIAEIGVAAYSSVLNGQRVVISIAEGFEEALTEPGAIAQFQALKNQLKKLNETYGDRITVLKDGDEDSFIEAIDKAVRSQRNEEACLQPISKDEIDKFIEKRKEKLKNPEKKVAVGGSSKAFDDSLITDLETKKSILRTIWGENDSLIAFDKEPFVQIWVEIDQIWDNLKSGEIEEDVAKTLVTKKLITAFNTEQQSKDDSDVLIWTVHGEASSKAASSEIGFMLLNALETGQQLSVLLEPFDLDLYVQTVLKKNIKSIRASVDAEENSEDKTAALEILDKLGGGDSGITFADFKSNPLLKKLPEFQEANRNRSVRSIMDKQLAKLQEQTREIAGENGEELFIFDNNILKYLEKNLKLLSQ